MPIYAYRCDECGFAKDVLQKVSDAPLTECPSCGKPAFKKQITAAGFQLKGSGWYVTDFRGGAKPASGEGSAAGTSAPAPAPSPAASTSEPAAAKPKTEGSGGTPSAS